MKTVDISELAAVRGGLTAQEAELIRRGCRSLNEYNFRPEWMRSPFARQIAAETREPLRETCRDNGVILQPLMND